MLSDWRSLVTTVYPSSKGCCSRRGDECCIGGGVVGEVVMGVVQEGVLSEKG